MNSAASFVIIMTTTEKSIEGCAGPFLVWQDDIFNEPFVCLLISIHNFLSVWMFDDSIENEKLEHKLYLKLIILWWLMFLTHITFFTQNTCELI